MGEIKWRMGWKAFVGRSFLVENFFITLLPLWAGLLVAFVVLQRVGKIMTHVLTAEAVYIFAVVTFASAFFKLSGLRDDENRLKDDRPTFLEHVKSVWHWTVFFGGISILAYAAYFAVALHTPGFDSDYLFPSNHLLAGLSLIISIYYAAKAQFLVEVSAGIAKEVGGSIGQPPGGKVQTSDVAAVEADQEVG